MNENNVGFYANVGVDGLQNFAATGGFDTFIDLQLAFPHIKDAKSILELGAAYGRCIDFLLANDFTGQIFGVDFIPNFVATLQQKFAGQSNVQIALGDIKNLALDQQFDVALWMWSGMIDFSRDEQIACMCHLKTVLHPGGKLIVDIPVLATGIGVGFAATTYQEQSQAQAAIQHLHLESQYGTLDCYIPSEADLHAYRQLAGFSSLEIVQYQTTANRPRDLCIFIK